MKLRKGRGGRMLRDLWNIRDRLSMLRYGYEVESKYVLLKETKKPRREVWVLFLNPF
jgi:hypothetical protein